MRPASFDGVRFFETVQILKKCNTFTDLGKEFQSERLFTNTKALLENEGFMRRVIKSSGRPLKQRSALLAP